MIEADTFFYLFVFAGIVSGHLGLWALLFSRIFKL